MITLRNMVVAFIKNDDSWLLMKRADNRSFHPNLISGIGGHIEQNEINNPAEAIYREIEEETGIEKCSIDSLNLLYILLRRKGDEIYQSYIYFGNTNKSELIGTDEGELEWVKTKELLQKEFSVTYSVMLKHYLNRNKKNEKTLYIGVATEKEHEHSMKIVFIKGLDFES